MLHGQEFRNCPFYAGSRAADEKDRACEPSGPVRITLDGTGALVVQAGVGRPEWRWKAASLGFDGPVDPTQTMRFCWSPPWLTALWRGALILAPSVDRLAAGAAVATTPARLAWPCRGARLRGGRGRIGMAQPAMARRAARTPDRSTALRARMHPLRSVEVAIDRGRLRLAITLTRPEAV